MYIYIYLFLTCTYLWKDIWYVYIYEKIYDMYIYIYIHEKYIIYDIYIYVYIYIYCVPNFDLVDMDWTLHCLKVCTHKFAAKCCDHCSCTNKPSLYGYIGNHRTLDCKEGKTNKCTPLKHYLNHIAQSGHTAHIDKTSDGCHAHV